MYGTTLEALWIYVIFLDMRSLSLYAFWMSQGSASIIYKLHAVI